MSKKQSKERAELYRLREYGKKLRKMKRQGERRIKEVSRG